METTLIAFLVFAAITVMSAVAVISARNPVHAALFLVLTKMDREFEQKAGETEESRRLRWSARLGNSLVNNFRGEWPLDWNGRPFNNSFWLRNPTVIDERLMDYDGGREVGIADSLIADFEGSGYFYDVRPRTDSQNQKLVIEMKTREAAPPLTAGG